MSRFIRIRRLSLAILGAAVFLGVLVTGVLAYPDPLYAYHAEAGRLRLYSDLPFDVAQGCAVLGDVEQRLAGAPAALRDQDSVYRVFVTNAIWRRRLVFLWNYGAGGVNYFPIERNVFLRQGDIFADRLLHGDGTAIAPPRTMAYFAAHEIGHSLTTRRIGALASLRLPEWLREGMADYIGFGGKVDIPDLTRRLRAGDRDLDPARSGLYVRYRLLVAYMLEVEHWTADRLLASGMSQQEAERRLLAGS